MKSALSAFLLAALAACGGPKAPWAEAPKASIDLVAKPSATTVPVLGEFALELDLWHRADLPVEFAPAVPDGFAGTVQLAPEQPLDRGLWQHATLRLRPIREPGKLAIPPFSAKAKDGTVSATTPEIELEVTTLLTAQPAEIEAPSALLSLPFPWLRTAGIALLALCLLGLGIWFARRRRVVPPPPPTVAVPPHVKALRELQRLRAAPRSDAAQMDAFYVATSDVLRRYLEERFGLHAPERTTEEFLLELEAGGPLSVTQCRELRRFLDQCDLVKFAAQRPEEAVHLATLGAAEQLVQETREDRMVGEESP